MMKFIIKGEELIGFLFCFVDISEGIKRAGGRLLPFGWYHILRDFKRTEWLNLNGMGVVPEYQGRGGPAVMYAALYDALKEFPQFKYADAVQLSEYNFKILNELKDFDIEMYKIHHIYRREV
jgi:GNAT superfamily N-acetyltransferase